MNAPADTLPADHLGGGAMTNTGQLRAALLNLVETSGIVRHASAAGQ